MKIAYSDFWSDFDPSTFPLTQIIRSLPSVEEVRDINEADFLLYSCMGEKHWFAPDNVIKIYYTGENITPDFNSCDYAIGFDKLEFGDRYLRFPLYYLYGGICEQMEVKHLKPIKNIVDEKTNFCSITVSNTNRNPIFKELYEKLSLYKKIDSGGKWNNNIGGPVKDKFSFDLKHKFSIVCENSATPGYTTEKLVQAFAADCIPIYWGDPTVECVFNKKSFINVQDYSSIEDVVKRVKEIDENDQLYYEILQEKALVNEQFCKEKQMIVLKSFLSNILTCPIEKSMRRNRVGQGILYINAHRQYVKNSNDILSRIRNIIAKYIQ